MKPMPIAIRIFCNYLGLAAAALLLLAGPSLAASNQDGVAVIIGNKGYQGRIPEVTYAHRDADAMRHYIIDVLGYDPDNVIDLRDASKAAMEAAFGNARDHKGRLWRYLNPDGGSDVVVFYSGHGVPGQKDRRGYLLPVNADPEAPEINGYPVDLLYSNLSKLKEARNVLVILEACFSGDSHQGMLIRAASGIFVQPKLPKQMGKLTVLTAAQGDQLASWDEKAQHGMFTERFLRAVYGAADKDGNRKVTLSEIKTYVGKQVRRAARRTYGREQQPAIKGDERNVLAILRGDASRPQLTMLRSDTAKPKNAPAQRVVVRQADQQMELEFWQSIKASNIASDFEAYLRQFPKGMFADLARSRREQFRPLDKAKPVGLPPNKFASANAGDNQAPASFDGEWSGTIRFSNKSTCPVKLLVRDRRIKDYFPCSSWSWGTGQFYIDVKVSVDGEVSGSMGDTHNDTSGQFRLSGNMNKIRGSTSWGVEVEIAMKKVE
jgi:hypothetical protein